ncbi:MAG: DUF3817 domain-containing protein [Flavobacterium sp.]|nr:DUF3817 domain-containing protein [Flavobacterium sp.]
MIKIFKFVTIAEGFSYLFLLANMLIVKPVNLHLYKTLLFPIGMSHGILFIAYIFLAFYAKLKLKWTFIDLLIVLVASFIPFGTFYIDKKYLKNV